MRRPIRLAIIGATGSVGRQALEVVSAFPEVFELVALAAANNAEAMAGLARQFRPRLVVMASAAAAAALQGQLPEGCRLSHGPGELDELARRDDVDCLLAAAVGQAGLSSLWAAISAGKRVALANKEALVMAGHLLMAQARRHQAEILPVDSEHAAAHQLLAGCPPQQLRRLLLTASGGPFWGRAPEELARVSAAEALSHPRWHMGRKISIDSATLMNKGFEVIEAHWLFGLPLEQIDVLVHPQSKAHALVEYQDGTLLAQLAEPDMRLPIAYALAYPERLPLLDRLPEAGRVGLGREALTFHPTSGDEIPALQLCRQAQAAGGGTPAALSVADEVAVEAFLAGRISFPTIVPILQKVVAETQGLPADTLDQCLEAGRQGERLARRFIAEESGE